MTEDEIRADERRKMLLTIMKARKDVVKDISSKFGVSAGVGAGLVFDIVKEFLVHVTPIRGVPGSGAFQDAGPAGPPREETVCIRFRPLPGVTMHAASPCLACGWPRCEHQQCFVGYEVEPDCPQDKAEDGKPLCRWCGLPRSVHTRTRWEET